MKEENNTLLISNSFMFSYFTFTDARRRLRREPYDLDRRVKGRFTVAGKFAFVLSDLDASFEFALSSYCTVVFASRIH